MNTEFDYVERLATVAVSELGDGAPDWEVSGLDYRDMETGEVRDKWTPEILVSLYSVSRKYADVEVYFFHAGDQTLASASAVTVDQIQEHALELTGGALLPPCPGHRHPLVARVVDGVPKWVCMKERERYYSRDVLPNFDPRLSMSEYLNSVRPR